MPTKSKVSISQWIIAAACAFALGGPSNRIIAADVDVKPAPTVFWDGSHLASIRAGDLNDDAQIKADLRQLRKNADSALKRGPYSVMQKEEYCHQWRQARLFELRALLVAKSGYTRWPALYPSRWPYKQRGPRQRRPRNYRPNVR